MPEPEPVASHLLRGLRLLALLLLILAGVLISLLAFGWLSAGARDRVAHRWFRLVLVALGVRLRVSGQTTLPSRPTLLVANHVSWLDIAAISAVRPVRFVSKHDVRDWPLMGWLATRAGTLYLDRSRGREARRVTHALTHALAAGQRVVVFPEGTTTDGRHVLPFKPMLLQAAIDAEACVVPVSLLYLDAAGRPTTAAAFTGDMSFFDTLLNIVAARRLQAAVEFHPPVDSQGLDRSALAAISESAIRAVVEPDPVS